jgi:hypothetical protein
VKGKHLVPGTVQLLKARLVMSRLIMRELG